MRASRPPDEPGTPIDTCGSKPRAGVEPARTHRSGESSGMTPGRQQMSSVTSVRAVVAIAAIAIATPLHAQTGTITGSVTSADGTRPIPGAQVRAGSGGAITGEDGQYTMVLDPGTYAVYVRRIGFSPDSALGIVVQAGQAARVDFQLQPSASVLEGMVVVGYGTREARDRTGVVETVAEEEFNTGRIISPEQLIQGKVAGVQVVDGGEPGGGISLRIRGGASVNASNEPLYVVDGIPLQIGGGVSSGRNPLNFLNPDDIASITVLKDASATAIYGSRGANGVVMITTKGGAGRPQVTYTSTASTSTVTSEPDLLNASQFSSAVQTHAPENVDLLLGANTNWRDAVQQTAGGQEHSLAVAGSRQQMNYRLALNYLDQDGVIQGTEVERISAALNYSDVFFDDRLIVRSSLIGSRNDDAFTPGGVIGAATSFAPTQPIHDSTGSFYEWSSALGPNNPVAELALASERGEVYRSIGKLEGEYTLPWLESTSATLRLGYDIARGERTNFFPSTMRSQMETSAFGTFFRSTPTQTNTLLDAFVTHSRRLESVESDLEVTAGYSFEESNGDSLAFRAESLATNLLGPNGTPAAARQRSFLLVNDSRLVSFFGRVNYGLRDKYLLTLTVRRDGSSKFGPEEQWGTFPSAAFAWRVVDEPFMSGLTQFSDLKLRVSWGMNGNQAIGNYLAFSSYEFSDVFTQAQFGNSFITTIRPSASDPGIKWEETTSYNIGLDYGFLNNRLTGAIDYYQKKTEDLLFNVPVAAGTNLSNFLTTNIGTLENRGFEFSINALLFDGTRGGFTWDASLNASTNTNELTQINAFGGGNEQILTGLISGGVGSSIQVLQPGHPINSFLVYRHKRGPDGRPIYEDANDDGTINEQDLYVDLDGDTVITQADRRPFKSPAPKWILGHSSQMTYGNFDASFTIRGYFGNYVYNNVASNLGHFSALRGEYPNNLHSSVLRNEFDNPQYFSDVYVEDASFIRMDNFSLGYTFRGLGSLDEVRVFGAVQNVFTITDYSGVDPLSGVTGIDNNIYPFSRIFTAGVTFGF